MTKGDGNSGRSGSTLQRLDVGSSSSRPPDDKGGSSVVRSAPGHIGNLPGVSRLAGKVNREKEINSGMRTIDMNTDFPPLPAKGDTILTRGVAAAPGTGLPQSQTQRMKTGSTDNIQSVPKIKRWQRRIAEGVKGRLEEDPEHTPDRGNKSKKRPPAKPDYKKVDTFSQLGVASHGHDTALVGDPPDTAAGGGGGGGRVSEGL
ncbi:hypothetical protein R1sor_005780 [Riccia sorocarpa]|uniref:Uncharacterized protein n=1 Tax=Riccia sorocarpa TaxID=122646 RepID=A0ABD3HP79_9MARC